MKHLVQITGYLYTFVISFWWLWSQFFGEVHALFSCTNNYDIILHCYLADLFYVNSDMILLCSYMLQFQALNLIDNSLFRSAGLWFNLNLSECRQMAPYGVNMSFLNHSLLCNQITQASHQIFLIWYSYLYWMF